MNNNELTETTNRKIDELKTEIISLPSGGGFEILRARLQEIRQGINNFIVQIDEIEKIGEEKP